MQADDLPAGHVQGELLKLLALKPSKLAARDVQATADRARRDAEQLDVESGDLMAQPHRRFVQLDLQARFLGDVLGEFRQSHAGRVITTQKIP